LNAAKRYTDPHRSTVQRVVLQASFCFVLREKIIRIKKLGALFQQTKLFSFAATHF
jgi:hypothetical protein